VYGQSNGLYDLGSGKWITASTKYVSYSNTATPTPAPVANKTLTVIVDSLNIRSDASFSSRIVDVAVKGQSFTILEERNGLYRIGTGRWITASTKYITLSGSAPTPTPTPAPAPSSDGQKIVNFASKYLGMKYVWASSDPANGGFDCSGFVYYVLKNNGYNISRLTAAGYWNMSTHITNPQVGDLVFLQNTYISGPSHMGIYVGNGQMIDANSARGVVIESLNTSYIKSHFLGYGHLQK
jgi:cell wall-associated NlpC family hydrolase